MMPEPEVSVDLHGSGAGIDPASRVQHKQTPIPASNDVGGDNENDSIDLSLSDSPPRAKPKSRRSASATMKPGGRAKSGGDLRAVLRAHAGGHAGLRSGRPPSPLVGRRGRVPSPAPERVTIKDPQRIETLRPDGEVPGDQTELLKRIVEQQRMDHDFLQEVARAVRALGGALESEVAGAVGFAECGPARI